MMQRFNVDYCHEPPPIRLTEAYIQGKKHECNHGRSLLKDFTKYLLINNIFNSEVYGVLFSMFIASAAKIDKATFTIHLQCMATSHTCCNHSTNTECVFANLLEEC